MDIHQPLDIARRLQLIAQRHGARGQGNAAEIDEAASIDADAVLIRKNQDRKSTRLNSSHSQISYAVFCLKKKKGTTPEGRPPTLCTVLATAPRPRRRWT